MHWLPCTGSDFIHKKFLIGNDGQPNSDTIAAILYPGGMADGEPENPLVVSDSRDNEFGRHLSEFTTAVRSNWNHA